MDLLDVQDVGWRVAFAPILDRIRFTVTTGEFVALMGRNGAGKSTLLDLVAGVRLPVAGSIMLQGRRLHGWSATERARLIGHLPQAVRPELPFTVDQLILMGRYPWADRWFESDADRAAVEHAMITWDCLEFRDRRVSTLSGGERQRVLLAACLAQAPRLLLLDEPATFLDVDQQLQCFSLLREETTKGTACIAVTHDVNLALTFCSRIVVLADHTIAYDAPTTEAYARPEWLGLFSSRLQLTTTPSGQPWVCYQ
jgi:ABC-type cobalamin/Fe3+-siderophores transport system ATPase subunit